MSDRWWHGWRLPKGGRWRLDLGEWRNHLKAAGASDLTVILLAILTVPFFYLLGKSKALLGPALFLPWLIGGLKLGTAQNITDPNGVTSGFWTSTLSAQAGVGATNEAKITNIIARAAALGYKYVYVPQSMLPFNASLVTFNVNVTMIREAGNPSTFDVRAYGAAGDAVQDDTAAFNAAIAGCLGAGDPTLVTRFANASLYFPGSHSTGNAQAVYLLTAEILIRSVQGLRIWGDGLTSTQLLFGANLTNGLNLDGLAHSLVEEFSVAIKTGFSLTNVINCHWGAGTFRNPTGNVFRHISVGNSPTLSNTYVNGYAIGTDNALAVDGFTFDRCVAYGAWLPGNVTTYQNGFVMGNGTGGNNLDHNFYNPECQSVNNGFNFNGSNGNIFGGQNELCGTDIVAANPLAPIKVSGFRSEQAQALYALSGFAGATVPVELENISWFGSKLTLAQAYPIITHNWSGALILRNIEIRGVANAGATTTVTCSPNTYLTILVQGFMAPNSQTIAQTFTSLNGNTPICYIIEGYGARNAAETLVVGQVPFRIYNPPVGTCTTSGMITTSIASGVITPTEAVLVSGIDARLGNALTVTLTAARLVGAPLNPVTGQRLTFTFIQGGAGAFAVTWNAVFKTSWADAGNATPKRSSIAYVYDGTNWNQDGAQTPYV